MNRIFLVIRKFLLVHFLLCPSFLLPFCSPSFPFAFPSCLIPLVWADLAFAYCERRGFKKKLYFNSWSKDNVHILAELDRWHFKGDLFCRMQGLVVGTRSTFNRTMLMAQILREKNPDYAILVACKCKQKNRITIARRSKIVVRNQLERLVWRRIWNIL